MKPATVAARHRSMLAFALWKNAVILFSDAKPPALCHADGIRFKNTTARLDLLAIYQARH
jgi:hypothetical protein